MKITLLCTGKTNEKQVSDLMQRYITRINNYCTFHIVETTDIKSNNTTDLKKKESALILKAAKQSDHLILLDEKGKEHTSIQFSAYIAKKQMDRTKHILFVIGGAFGFSEEVYKAAHAKMSLSKMTFPHQLVRIFFLEQVYRAFTILNNEQYHH